MVTIFTPVYNRSYIIEKLYESLKRQTDTNFEWIIIDDGSTDHLGEKVQKWIGENNVFKIHYRYVAHGGKHRAINQAVRMATGEAFFIVDSDDYLSDDAVYYVKKKFCDITQNSDIAAISGLKAHFDGTVIGGEPTFDGEFVDILPFDVDKYGLSGDKAEVYITDLLKQYPFSEYEGEDFLFEGTVWNKIALDGYKIRYYKKIIYYAEYRTDGLSKNIYKKLINNPYGWAESLRIRQRYRDPKVYRLFAHYCYVNNKFGMEKLSQLLAISKAECEWYSKVNEEFDECLKHLLVQGEGVSAAIYGCGMFAHFFMRHLHKFDYEIMYGIDRSVKVFEGKKVYSLTEEMPHVKMVFIAVSNLTADSMKGIRTAICSKLPNTEIWFLQEIDDRLW